MDFFGHQEQARRATRRLIILYALAVLAIIVLLYLVVSMSLRGYSSARPEAGVEAPGWLQWDLLLAVAAGVLVVVGAGSLFKVSQLRSGGSVVAEMLGGRLVQPNTKDDLERRLLNVVEEMSIASGTAVPSVYIMDRETEINAFAAGWSPDDAAVAVTRGCLEQLTRDELQGVIAHEFSHVFHGDMRINIRLLGVLHGITCIAIGGYMLLRVGAMSGSGNRKQSGVPILALAIGMLVVGYVGVIFARIIKASVSRQREFLADAAAVQYTRNPRGLGHALRRISGEGSRVRHGRTEDASHMFFANAVGKMWFNWLATHPPISERIKRLGREAQTPLSQVRSTAAEPEQGDTERPSARPSRGPGGLGSGGLGGLPGVELPGGLGLAAAAAISPDALMDTVGEPQGEHVARAREILQAIPDELREAAHDPYAARALLCALLLDGSETVRAAQFAAIEGQLGGEIRHAVAELRPAVAGLPTAVRLPLVELTMPGLRSTSADQFKALLRALEALARADQHISPFEIAMNMVVRKHLGGHFHPRPGSRPAFRKFGEVAGAMACLLSVMARAGAGSADEATARSALEAAAKVLGPGPSAALSLVPPEECGLDGVHRALEQLTRSSSSLKRAFLLAAARVAGRDGLISVAEGELIRAFAEVLDCPMPPLLGAPPEE